MNQLDWNLSKSFTEMFSKFSTNQNICVCQSPSFKTTLIYIIIYFFICEVKTFLIFDNTLSFMKIKISEIFDQC